MATDNLGKNCDIMASSILLEFEVVRQLPITASELLIHSAYNFHTFCCVKMYLWKYKQHLKSMFNIL
jgi:hypothetical protein